MINWERLERRVRYVLSEVSRAPVIEGKLRDALTRIDAIVGVETGRGMQIPPNLLSGVRSDDLVKAEYEAHSVVVAERL